MFLVRRVVGSSMSPNLFEGQTIISWTWYRKLRPGDVVIIKHRGMEKIKRVAQIQQKKIYVLGDNQAESTDSRSWGWLPLNAVRSKVLWPATKPVKNSKI
jgi:phage repressor protein C with HTH and peptisase S24 domain